MIDKKMNALTLNSIGLTIFLLVVINLYLEKKWCKLYL